VAALVCGSCGTELPPNSKFCNECGAAVATATTPLRHADLLTDGGVTEWPRTDLTGDHVTGVKSHPQLEVHTIALLDVGCKPLRLLLDVLPGARLSPLGAQAIPTDQSAASPQQNSPQLEATTTTSALTRLSVE
jgi:hypothetical protein